MKDVYNKENFFDVADIEAIFHLEYHKNISFVTQ